MTNYNYNYKEFIAQCIVLCDKSIKNIRLKRRNMPKLPECGQKRVFMRGSFWYVFKYAAYPALCSSKEDRRFRAAEWILRKIQKNGEMPVILTTKI